MATEGAGGCKLTQLVTDHILGDVYGNMTASVVDSDGVTNKSRENC